jgi:hypothetical protein
MADYFHGSMAESAPLEEIIPRYRIPESINFFKVPKCVPVPVTISTVYSMYCILLCTCVAGKEMGVLGCVGDHILQDESKEKHGVWEPVDYNLTLCRLRHISLCQSRP